MTKPGEHTKTVVYKDFWFKIIGCLVSSELIDSLGRKESIFHRIATKAFLIDLLGGFVISLVLWELVRYVTKQLDRRYDWLDQPVQRIALQLIFGLILPSALSFVFTLLFMEIILHQDIFQTTWLYSEFYAVILIIVLINMVYFTWWLFLQSKPRTSLNTISRTEGIQHDNPQLQLYPAIEVSKGNANILLLPDEIAYITLEGAYSFIQTHEGECFVTTYTLDELIKKLSEDSFFRANRQAIISRKSCKAYKRIEHGKISLELMPSPKSQIIISQKRASDFRKWIPGGKAATSPDILQA